jgi:hypothetical protein
VVRCWESLARTRLTLVGAIDVYILQALEAAIEQAVALGYDLSIDLREMDPVPPDLLYDFATLTEDVPGCRLIHR